MEGYKCRRKMKNFGIRQTGFDSWLCYLKDTESVT